MAARQPDAYTTAREIDRREKAFAETLKERIRVMHEAARQKHDEKCAELLARLPADEREKCQRLLAAQNGETKDA